MFKLKDIREFKKNKKIIDKSGIFSSKYYLRCYHDARVSNETPLNHFIKFGLNGDRKPNKHFDPIWYREYYKDVKEDGGYPFIHFILFGLKENRFQNLKEQQIYDSLKDDFDIESYKNSYNDLKIQKEGFDFILHYVRYGKGEGRLMQRKIKTKKENKDIKSIEVKGLVLVVDAKKSDDYTLWLNVNSITKNRRDYLEKNLKNKKIKISVIIPVYNPPLKFLKKAIESVCKQIYTNWEICMVDDCSTDTYVQPFLEQLQKNYPNIKLKFNKINSHISETTNTAVSMADGDFLVFLDQDDELEHDAFAEIVLYIGKYQNTEILYSDDDKIDAEGNKFDPQFKPDFSPEYLLSFMYCGHLKCVKKSLYKKLGGFKKGYEGSQDYDFFLRATEKARHVGHIQRILYHWRAIQNSTAVNGKKKDYSFKAGLKAVKDALNRKKVRGTVYQPDWALKNGNGIYSIDFPDTGKSVGIIIPTKNRYDMLKQCINSIKTTTYKNYKIYIIDNESDDKQTINYLNNLKNINVLKIKSPNGKFNYAYINNEAVKYVKEELLLFLNNDTKVINPKWLSQMVGYLQFDGVGSVGAKLFFPDNRIQHAGILHNISHGFPITSGRLLANWEWGYMASAVTSKNFLAVTAACMLTPKTLFKRLSGFNEKDFAVAFNDCDYGYRLHNAGYRNVLAPQAELYHHEGETRGKSDDPKEEANYIRKYGKWLDPYYNQNLALSCSRYKIDSKTVTLHKIPKFKIFMVTHSLNLEGAPKSFFELAKILKKNTSVIPIIVSHADGPLMQLYKEEGMDVHIVEEFNLLNIDTDEQIELFLEKQTQLIKSFGADVVYGNTIEAFWAIKCAKKLNLPSVWNIRESENPFSSYNHNTKIKNRMMKTICYPYKVVFVADATKAMYESLNTQNNFMTIHNGFDEELAQKRTQNLHRDVIRKELSIVENEICILALGTVCSRKGQIDLVQAIEKLDDKDMEKIKVYIVGDRKSLPYSQEMHEIIDMLPINKQEKIVVVNETMDVYKYYMAGDIFVCNSRVESFPKVIQEAMYYKLAIITTPVFGIVEQVKDNVSALYYDPADIGKLVENLKKLLDDDSLRKEIAINAKTALGILPTIEEMSLAYEKVFQEAWLSGKAR